MIRAAVALILLMCASDVSAETIRLKSGATFEATIVEQNAQEIVIEIPGLGRERIQRSELATGAASGSDTPVDADMARWGIRFIPEPGWIKLPSGDETSISFRKQGVAVLGFGRRLASEAASEMVKFFTSGHKNPVTFAGVEGTQISEDVKASTGQTARARTYWLHRGGYVILVSCVSDPAHFETALAACDAALSSFRFIEP